MKTNGRNLALILSALFVASQGVSFAKPATDSKNKPAVSSLVSKTTCGINNKTVFSPTSSIIARARRHTKRPQGIKIHTKENSYQPYVQFGGTRFFHVNTAKSAMTADLFVPLWQQDLTHLLFTDLRANDRSGTPFEGNVHVGYRHLSADNQKSFGVYGAFDRRKTEASNYFSQLTLGGEYWLKKFFVGGNLYRPIGESTRKISENVSLTESNEGVYRSINVTKSLLNEKAMPGVDAEVGYEFKEGLVGYIGGYYFGANNVTAVCGPRARLTYDWSLASGNRILGIFDKVGLEAGVQNDTPRGTIAYLSANVRIGWLPDEHTVLQGVSRHMIDPVRRDIDIVSNDEAQISQLNANPLIIKTVRDPKTLSDTLLNESKVDAIDAGFEINSGNVAEVKTAIQNPNNVNKKAVILISDTLSQANIAALTNTPIIADARHTLPPVKLVEEGGITQDARDILGQGSPNRFITDSNSIIPEPTLIDDDDNGGGGGAAPPLQHTSEIIAGGGEGTGVKSVGYAGLVESPLEKVVMDEEEYYDNPQEFKKASEPEKGAVRAETLPSPPPPPTASLTTAEAGLIKSLQRTYTREELIIKMQARCKGNLARKNLQQAKKDTAASTAKAGLGVVKLAYQATSTVVKAARAKSIGDAFETLSERKDDIADAAKDALSNTSSVIGNAKHTRELKREAAAIQQHAEGRIQELEARKQRAEMALDGVLDSSQSAKLLEKQNQDIEKIQQNIRKVEKSRRQLKRLSREISTLDVTNQQNASAAPNIDPIEQRIAALTIERALLRNQERKRKTKSYLQIAHKSYQAASSAAAVISKGVSTTVDLVSVVATTPTVVVAIIMAGQTALDAGKVVVAAGNTISRGVALASSVRDERRLSRQYSETMLQTTNELHELRRTQTQSRLQTIQLMEE